MNIPPSNIFQCCFPLKDFTKNISCCFSLLTTYALSLSSKKVSSIWVTVLWARFVAFNPHRVSLSLNRLSSFVAIVICFKEFLQNFVVWIYAIFW